MALGFMFPGQGSQTVGMLAISTSQASQMADECDVLIASGDTVLLADILEDELLLAVPEKLCDSNGDTKECERLLPPYYPAAGKAQLEEAEQSERKNPFDVLANLKQ